jgi:hypothetical protein
MSLRNGLGLAMSVLFTLVSQPTLAYEQHIGTITMFHLNGDVADRGVCVQMTPALPASGYACLWKANPLYKEITTLLLAGYMVGKSCRVAWAAPTDGLLQIVWAECV